MGKKITWESLLERNDIVGGELETYEYGEIYRGPIESISLNGVSVSFKSPWVAILNQETGVWKNWDVTLFGTMTVYDPIDLGDGRILLRTVRGSFSFIFLKGGTKLDPAKVKGLTPQ